MKDSNLPNLFLAADKASLTAQNRFLLFTKLELSSMIIGAILSVLSYALNQNQDILIGAAVISLLLSLSFTITKKIKNYGRSWYEGRALAESVKTLSWRYICQAEGFESSLANSRTEFINRIAEVKDGFQSLIPDLDAESLAKPSVSNEMESIRESDLKDRVDKYKASRIEPQIKWYTVKATYNYKLGLMFFWIQIIFQFSAIISGIFLLLSEYHNISIIGMFTTLSISVLSWIQVKRYDDLNTAYTATTMELAKIRDLFEQIATEKQFSRFVLDSENAISREHTTWLAQRRT